MSADRRRSSFSCHRRAAGIFLCLSMLASPTCSQLVGCDVLDCGSANHSCTLGNATNAFIGTTSFNSSVSPSAPLTWTVGASTDDSSSNLTDVTFTKNFYLGFPPTLDLAGSTEVAGCALFFEGIARSISMSGVTEYGSMTCGQALQDSCVHDLLEQAKQQVQTLRTAGDADNAAVCTSLQTTLEARPPQSCQTIAQVSWGSIIPKGITGSAAPIDPITQTTCHPSTGGKDYKVALVETQTVTSEEVSSDPAPFFYSITPVLTVFYSPGDSASQGSALPEAHLSCLKVVEDSSLAQPNETNSAGRRSLPNSMVWLLLAVSALAWD